MAGLCGLKILLLWTGIIGLTNRQTIDGQTVPASSPPQCSYTVTTIKFGFQIDISSSNYGAYTINLEEEDQPGERITVQHSSQSSSHQIKHLKPCTEYEHNVTYLDGAEEDKTCRHAEDKTRTTHISQEDITPDISCIPGHVCYKSDWDLSSLQPTPNKIPDVQCGDKTFCVKPGYDDICSDLTTNFISKKCGKFFILTTSIPVDFVNSVKIPQTAPTEPSAKIETKLPPKCKGLSIDYTCWERGRDHEPKKESELEPYTDYNCTGQIKDNNNNNNTIKTTTAVHVKIKCDFEINTKASSVTNTVINFSWNTTSVKCPSVLHELEKLSYICRCSYNYGDLQITADKHPSGGTCHVTDFRVYECEVNLLYKGNIIKVGHRYTGFGTGYPTGIVFLIIISSIITLEVVFVVVYMVSIKKCRKSRDDMTEDMMTTTAIYVNAPTPGGRHKKDS